jgi:hypothetical protein
MRECAAKQRGCQRTLQQQQFVVQITRRGCAKSAEMKAATHNQQVRTEERRSRRVKAPTREPARWNKHEHEYHVGPVYMKPIQRRDCLIAAPVIQASAAAA